MAPRRARDGALGAGQGGLMEFPFAIAFVISGFPFGGPQHQRPRDDWFAVD